jgi:DNA polymerase-3 subunit beta
MKLTLTQSDLNQALKLVSRAVGNGKSHHPILASVLLKADDGNLSVTAYNLELGITTGVLSIVDEKGVTAVPYKLLSDIVSRLDQDAAISVQHKDDFLFLKTPAGTYKLATAPADDFPDLPVVDTGVAARLSISDALKAVLTCCSADECKQALTGVHLTVQDKVLRLEATDGHRLAIRKLPCDSPDLDLLLPSKTMQQLLRMDAAQVSILSSKHQVNIVDEDGTTVISRTIDGTFPGVDKLIPKTFEHHLSVDRRRLVQSLERISAISSGGTNIVKLTADEAIGILSVTAECETSSGQESIACGGTLPGLAVNVTYLLDALKHFKGESIEIKVNGPTTPVVIQPEDSDNELYLVIPVQVRS